MCPLPSSISLSPLNCTCSSPERHCYPTQAQLLHHSLPSFPLALPSPLSRPPQSFTIQSTEQTTNIPQDTPNPAPYSTPKPAPSKNSSRNPSQAPHPHHTSPSQEHSPPTLAAFNLSTRQHQSAYSPPISPASPLPSYKVKEQARGKTSPTHGAGGREMTLGNM